MVYEMYKLFASKRVVLLLNNPSLRRVALLCTDPETGDWESFDKKDPC